MTIGFYKGHDGSLEQYDSFVDCAGIAVRDFRRCDMHYFDRKVVQHARCDKYFDKYLNRLRRNARNIGPPTRYTGEDLPLTRAHKIALLALQNRQGLLVRTKALRSSLNLRGQGRRRASAHANLLHDPNRLQGVFQLDESEDCIKDDVCQPTSQQAARMLRKPTKISRKGKMPSSQKAETETPHASRARLAALTSGEWPRKLQENLRVAANLLRKIAKSQRPSSLDTLAAWVRHRGCCRVRSDVLMTPGALAAALIPLFDDAPANQCVLAPLATALTGINAKDNGPPHRRSAKVAERVHARLHVMKVNLSDWSWQQCAQFLCKQSFHWLEVDPQALVKEMLARGCVQCTEDARCVYDEKVLATIPNPFQRCSWRLSDFNLFHIHRSALDLGGLDTATQIASHLTDKGLMSVKDRWLRDALAELGCDAPAHCAVGAKLVGGRVVLTTSVVGTKDAMNSFSQAVRQKSQAYFTCLCPDYFRSCKREHLMRASEAWLLKQSRERERQQRSRVRETLLRKLEQLEEQPFQQEIILIEQFIIFCKNLTKGSDTYQAGSETQAKKKARIRSVEGHLKHDLATLRLFGLLRLDVPWTLREISGALEQLEGMLETYKRKVSVWKADTMNHRAALLIELQHYQ